MILEKKQKGFKMNYLMKKLDAKLKIKLIYCCCCSSKILWVFISFIINFLHFIHILTIRIIFLFLLPTLLFIFHFHLGCFITSFLLQPLRIWEKILKHFLLYISFHICHMHHRNFLSQFFLWQTVPKIQ